MEKATFSAGCFWHVQTVFDQVKGVEKTCVGYTGGHVVAPHYEEVCKGNTGHAEAIEILFDPQIISYETLLDIFWRMHDPTTLNKQGVDVGQQYRSAIFYHSIRQKKLAEASKEKIGDSFADPIVTEIKESSTFYEAEAYHQKYFEKKS